MFPMKFRARTIKNTVDHMLKNVLKFLGVVELSDADETLTVKFDSMLEAMSELYTYWMAAE